MSKHLKWKVPFIQLCFLWFFLHTFSPFCGHEAALLFNLLVQILTIFSHVRCRVLSNEIDLVLEHELVGYLPGSTSDDLVDVTTVSDRLVTLHVAQYGSPLKRVCQFVVAGAWERSNMLSTTSDYEELMINLPIIR